MSFEHYISYGSTDQETLRDLAASYDGLIVPGTIAAFQSDGTRGFVLTWSASNGKPYVIDSRFPLFQNALPKAKKSHVMLAEILGDPSLVSSVVPSPSDFRLERLQLIAERWVHFNLGFDEVKSKIFDKYAARLGEPVLPDNRSRPAFVLPPYFMADGVDDPWFKLSTDLWQMTAKMTASGPVESRRVLAATNPQGLEEMLSTASEGSDVVIWVSGLDEYRSDYKTLLGYRRAVVAAGARRLQPFALYGGYFAVLLGHFGLHGASHGVGFGDHRDWIELPSSGAPQARFYVFALHRYVPVDLAVALWRISPELIVDPRYGNPEVSPGSLDYHSLMKHSLSMRAAEIDFVNERTLDELVTDLRAASGAFSSAIADLEVPRSMQRRADELHGHLGIWAAVLEADTEAMR